MLFYEPLTGCGDAVTAPHVKHRDQSAAVRGRDDVRRNETFEAGDVAILGRQDESVEKTSLLGAELAGILRPFATCCRARVTTCRALASSSRRTFAMSRYG